MVKKLPSEPQLPRLGPQQAAVGAFATSRGWVGLALTGEGLLATSYMHRSEQNALRSIVASSRLTGLEVSTLDREGLASWQTHLEAYFAGEPVDLSCIPLDTRGWSDFRTRVYQYVKNIPYGSVASYGEVAQKVGNPRAARAVGRAMATNPVAPVVPCHRVIASDGSLGGFSGTGGLAFKRELLQMEGWL
jgi:methylated-DNA-[protein]-cysteine S-methyltransferase